MTIQEYVDDFKLEIDELWVKDSKGNYITAPGDKQFTNVEVVHFDNNTFASLIFTI